MQEDMRAAVPSRRILLGLNPGLSWSKRFEPLAACRGKTFSLANHRLFNPMIKSKRERRQRHQQDHPARPFRGVGDSLKGQPDADEMSEVNSVRIAGDGVEDPMADRICHLLKLRDRDGKSQAAVPGITV